MEDRENAADMNVRQVIHMNLHHHYFSATFLCTCVLLLNEIHAHHTTTKLIIWTARVFLVVIYLFIHICHY